MAQHVVDLVCLILFMNSVTPEWIGNKGLWYFISRDANVDYQQAGAICESMSSRLAVITNDHQNTFLTNHTDDRIGRWIGLSNVKTRKYNTNTCWQNWVWNDDWQCQIYYRRHFMASRHCMGVTINNGQWDTMPCVAKNGFICQWECKRVYFFFESKPDLSGIYKFHEYYVGNLVYTKEGNDDTRILFSAFLKQWVVEQGQYNVNVRCGTQFYVPYERILSCSIFDWSSRENVAIMALSFCIECEKFHLCVKLPSGIPECYGTFNLDYDGVSIPTYVNDNQQLYLNHSENSEFCICNVDMSDCGNRCGYIFPYPYETTPISLDNNQLAFFTNLCWKTQLNNTTAVTIQNDESTARHQTTSKYVYSSTIFTIENYSPNITTAMTQNGKTSSQENLLSTISIESENVQKLKSTANSLTRSINEQKDNSILIPTAVSISLLVLVVSVVVAIALLIRKKRNMTNGSDSLQSCKRVSLPNLSYTADIAKDDNVYVELEEHNSRIAKPANATPGFHQHASRAFITNSPNDIYKEQPADRYLAPDYGALTKDISAPRQNAISDSSTCTTSEPVYTEPKKKCGRNENHIRNKNQHTRTLNSTAQSYVNDDDIQLHENELYKSHTDNVIDGSTNVANIDSYDLGKESIPDETNDNAYYNTGHLEIADEDELELFENSVYGQTQ